MAIRFCNLPAAVKEAAKAGMLAVLLRSMGGSTEVEEEDWEEVLAEAETEPAIDI